MIRRSVLVPVSVIASLVTAHAADMYGSAPGGPGGYKDEFIPAPVWGGFYAGVNAGYGWSARSNDAGITDYSVLGVIGSGRASFDSSGGFGGGQIGYNLQRDRFIFGVEADLQAADVSGKTTLLSPGSTVEARADLTWFGRVRGRLGYAYDKALFFVSAGFAVGGIKDNLSIAHGCCVALNGVSATEQGYALGGGLEYRFDQAWSLKAEYQYMDLGKENLSATAGDFPAIGVASASVDNVYHTVRVGLNYHFAPSYQPLK